MKPNYNASMQELASQLKTPHGDKGVKVADMMNESNIAMTRECFLQLDLKPYQHLLEIGHGNAAHLTCFLKFQKDLRYTGLEISELMYQQAKIINDQWIQSHHADFQLYKGEVLPFEDNSLDAVMTVNTIYFWPQPKEFLKEILRVLKPEGRLGIAFAQKKFMEQLPFTGYGFQLYSLDDVTSMVTSAGFNTVKSKFSYDRVINKADPSTFIEREFVLVEASNI